MRGQLRPSSSSRSSCLGWIGCCSVMRSGLEIGPDAAAPRVLLIRGRFGRGNCQAYTNQCGRYQQLLPRSAVSSALLGKNLPRSEEHTSELQSLMRISYAVFCLKNKKKTTQDNTRPDLN